MNIWVVGKDLMKHYYMKKKHFYNNLNIKNITVVDYRHAKRIFKEFKINNLGDYHDIYVQSDTLLLADLFEDF